VTNPSTGAVLGNVPKTGAAEETFGPVAPPFRFNDEAQAIQMANDTEFGLDRSRDLPRRLAALRAVPEEVRAVGGPG